MRVIMNIQNQISEIEERAKGFGLSINELCKRAGIDRSTFTKWKSGKSKPNMETYTSIQNALKEAGGV